MDLLVTHGIAFFVGAATGAAGTYLADKFTDQRREKEQHKRAKREFEQVATVMPDLLEEMQKDLSSAEFIAVREFFVIPKGTQIYSPGKRFFYEEDDKNSYLAKTRILEDHGYVIDITPGNAPLFRMQEHFVRLVTQRKMPNK